MAAKANVIGIIVQPGGTALIGRESTVADDGVAGINLRGYVSASFIQTANDSSANYHANASGSNISGSRESYSKTTGFNAGNYNLQIYNGAMDTAAVLKYLIAHSAADKKVMLADDDLSDVSFDTGTTSILDSTLSTPSAITIGSNAGSANTVVDVSSSNHTIRCGQGMNFYNGGTLLARASTLRLGTSNSGSFDGEDSSRYGINLSNGKIGGASTSAAPTGTWHVSSIKSTSGSNILRFTTGTCTITGKNTSDDRFLNITAGNIYHSDGTLAITSDTTSHMIWTSTTQDDGPYNLLINHASNETRLSDSFKVINNATVTAGVFKMNGRNIDVHKQLLVNGGTFTSDGGTHDIGDVKLSSGTINGNTATIDINQGTDGGWAFQQTGGTWNYNTSTVVQKANDKHINVDFYNLKIEVGTNNSTVWRDQSGNTMTVANDLTIVEGTLKRDNNSDKLDVNGDVSIESGGKLNHTGGAESGEDEFGSLTIASGGTYTATSGTTTITDVYSSPFALSNSGTFTHNHGTLLLNRSGNQDFLGTWTGSSALYNLNINGSGGTQQLRANMLIEGGLTITNGNFSTHSNNYDLTVVDLITVNGGTFTTNSSTINCGGIRNVGGTIS